MINVMARYSKGYRVRTALAALLQACEVFLEVLIPTMMAYIIDVAAPVATGTYTYGLDGMSFWDGFIDSYPAFASGTTLLWSLGAVCLLLAFLSLLSGALSARNISVASAGYASNLRMAVFSKVQSFSFANTDKFSTAGLVTRCTTDINNAQQTYSLSCRIIIRAILLIVMSTIFAFNLSSDISMIFLVALPIMAVAMVTLSTLTMPIFKRMLSRYDDMNRGIQENLVAQRVVKAFVREDYESDKYDASAEKVRFAQLSAEKMMTLTNPIVMGAMYVVNVAILYIGGSKIIDGTMLSGTLTSLISYASLCLGGMMMVCFIVIQIVLSKTSIERIKTALNEESTIVDGDQPDKTVNSGSIEFNHVNFSYSNNGDNLTLADINFSISSGETVGIIAGTGEGKTSLVSLIPRFYDVYSGSILVDGVDVRSYAVDKLRDGVSMVLQKNVLFSGTISDNLRWGDMNATQDDIEQACKIAQAHDFVMSFPDKYDTDLGQGGVNVSGGQKQRLCIARALIKKPKIMILDDSTSAVDTATDANIREGLHTLANDMTVIIIAQRISSIENCDKIVVLHEGKVDAVGTHEQLLANNTIYQEVYTSQNKASTDSTLAKTTKTTKTASKGSKKKSTKEVK